MSLLAALLQQAEVFRTAQTSRPEVVLDNEHRDFPVGRNHHRTRRPFPAVSAVAALLIFEVKAGPQKDAFQRLPVHRRPSRHCSLSNRHFTPLDRDPRRTLPRSLGVAFVACFFQHRVESSRLRTAGDKGAHRFIHRASGRFGIGARASHIKRHRVGDVLIAFAPNIDGVIDIHQSDILIKRRSNQAVCEPLLSRALVRGTKAGGSAS